MKILISIIVLLLHIPSGEPQQIGKRLTARSILIYNNSNSRISFLLVEGEKSDTISISANKSWLSPSYKSNPIIKIQTQNFISNYQLNLGNSYVIFWNEEKKIWDVGRFKKGQ